MGDGVNPNEIELTSDSHVEKIRTSNGKLQKIGRRYNGGRDPLMGEMKARMAALYKDGATRVEIAETVSDEFNLEGDQRLSARGIDYHIKTMKQYWRDVGLLHIDERQAMILARYDQLEMLAMEAYFASCEGRSTNHYEKSSDRVRSKEREKMLLEQIQEERVRRKAELGEREKNNPKFEFRLNDGDLEEALITTHEKIKEYSRTDTNLSGDPKWVSIMVDINDKRAALWGLKSRKGPSNEDQERAKLSDEQRDARLAAVLSSAMQRKEKNMSNLAEPAPLGGWKEGETPAENTNSVVVVAGDDEWEVPTELKEVPLDADFDFDLSEESDD